MTDKLRNAMKSYWVLSLFCIILGAALIADPHFFTNAIGYVIGSLICLYGVIRIVKYFLDSRNAPAQATGLTSGVIFLAAGIFINIRPDFIPKVIAVIFGIYMLVSGIVNIQDAMNIRSSGSPMYKRALIPGICTAVIGLIILVNPFFLTDIALTVLGIALLISGISNIAGCFSAGRVLKQYRRDSGSDDKEYIDI
ncbi:MAG: DUF308 domain-containing protein [Ruminococcus sp.]|nr:DUF308 domain-containing protein [Ruminococcus sp.]MBR1864049.1 DUF308 domain-containing protein [Ruminococcus sp.]